MCASILCSGELGHSSKCIRSIQNLRSCSTYTSFVNSTFSLVQSVSTVHCRVVLHSRESLFLMGSDLSPSMALTHHMPCSQRASLALSCKAGGAGRRDGKGTRSAGAGTPQKSGLAGALAGCHAHGAAGGPSQSRGGTYGKGATGLTSTQRIFECICRESRDPGDYHLRSYQAHMVRTVLASKVHGTIEFC